MQDLSLYRASPNDLARYSRAEAARYLHISPSTLRSWVLGRPYPVADGERYSQGLVQLPDSRDDRLSFSNLIEAYVLLALRKQFRVKMREVRQALDYARKHLRIERVLLSPQLRVMRGSMFWLHLDQLIDLGKGGQEAMPEILAAYLERIEWEPDGGPARIFPFSRPEALSSPRLVKIDPLLAFGRPVLERRAVTTAVIAERFKVGESIGEIAQDYDLQASEVEEALRYEALALAA